MNLSTLLLRLLWGFLCLFFTITPFFDALINKVDELVVFGQRKLTADSFVMRYIIAPSLLAGRGLGVGLSYLIYLETAVSLPLSDYTPHDSYVASRLFQQPLFK